MKFEHGKEGLYYSALEAWNETPAIVRETSVLEHFNKELNASSMI